MHMYKRSTAKQLLKRLMEASIDRRNLLAHGVENYPHQNECKVDMLYDGTFESDPDLGASPESGFHFAEQHTCRPCALNAADCIELADEVAEEFSLPKGSCIVWYDNQLYDQEEGRHLFRCLWVTKTKPCLVTSTFFDGHRRQSFDVKEFLFGVVY